MSFENQVVVLTADRHLLVVQPSLGKVVVDLSPRPVPGRIQSLSAEFGHYLAISADRQTLVALLPGSGQVLDVLEIVGLASGKIERSVSLPSGITYHTIAVGPTSGQIYVLGNRTQKRPTSATAPDQKDVILTTVDRRSGNIKSTTVIKNASGHDWQVYDAALTVTEDRLFVSYHGTDTTGIDWFNSSLSEWHQCDVPNVHAGHGCIDSHGSMQLYGDQLLASTGSQTILQMSLSGQVNHTIDTGLAGNHLMEFAADPATGRLYALGPCNYSGGFAVADVAAGRPIVHLDRAPLTGGQRVADLCGDRVALWQHRELAVSQTGGVLLLDAATGAELHMVRMSAQPLDVISVE